LSWFYLSKGIFQKIQNWFLKTWFSGKFGICFGQSRSAKQTLKTVGFGQNKSHPHFGWLVCLSFWSAGWAPCKPGLGLHGLRSPRLRIRLKRMAWGNDRKAKSQKPIAAFPPLLIYALKPALPGHVFQYLFFSLNFGPRAAPSPHLQVGVSAAKLAV
jgi:hypothetical protein